MKHWNIGQGGPLAGNQTVRVPTFEEVLRELSAAVLNVDLWEVNRVQEA